MTTHKVAGRVWVDATDDNGAPELVSEGARWNLRVNLLSLDYVVTTRDGQRVASGCGNTVDQALTRAVETEARVNALLSARAAMVLDGLRESQAMERRAERVARCASRQVAWVSRAWVAVASAWLRLTGRGVGRG